MKHHRDNIFDNDQAVEEVSAFAFDKKVVDVFQDMIARSVPGYQLSLQMISILAADFIQENSHVYDLGCSLGASMIPITQGAANRTFHLHGVDNSPAMIDQCREVLQSKIPEKTVDLICADIQDVDFQTSSLILLNFTLQFIPLTDRLPLLDKIYHSLLPGGAVLLSEKISFPSDNIQEKQTKWHHAFKAQQGYSQLEIAKKRQSLENVLLPEEMTTHISRLKQAGFSTVIPWFQCFSFVSLVAIK